MERPGETLEAGGVGEEGVAERGADEMRGVRGDVAALVVAVQREVQAEEVLEVLVLLAAAAEHGCEVVRPILLEVDLGREGAAALVRVVVDLGGDGGELREQRDGVVEGRLPVVGLADAGLVGLGELGGVVQGRDGDGELRHRVQVFGEVVEQLIDEVGELALLGELAGELAGLCDGGDLAGEEEPEHGFWEHFGA